VTQGEPTAPTGAGGGVEAAAPPRRRRVRRRWLVLGLVVALVAALVAGAAWYVSPREVLPEATAALASSPGATFARESTGLTYTATGAPPTTGLVLYPGAKVPAEAYAPTARAIAEAGYLVVVVPMPLNFALLGIGAAADVATAHPEIRRWAVGGHSLGGAMAAQFASDHLDLVDGLALCGAYSAADLSVSGLEVSSVYGSLDAAAPTIEDAATAARLPATTAYERIEGGNHEQCGWYTGQPDDPPATISREDQQVRIVAAWIALLEEVAASP
jgi:pimeloyl-ACP methyl ester carboxylesterase